LLVWQNNGSCFGWKGKFRYLDSIVQIAGAKYISISY